MAIGAATPALAFQIPTTPTGTWTGTGTTQAATKDTPSSLRTTVNVTGQTTVSARNDTSLLVSGATHIPALPVTANGVQVLSTIVNCQTLFAAAVTCSPGTLGTVTVAFTDTAGNPIAVTDPVLHLSRLGGAITVGGNTIRTTALLRLDTVGATLGTPATGSRIVVLGGNTIAGDLAQITTTNPGVCPNAGCGSIPIVGTVSQLTFSIGAQRSATTVAWNGVAGAGDAYFLTPSFGEDFGDAPASYDATTAASHLRGDLRLGSAVTADNTTTINGGATGTPLITPSPIASATAAGDSDDATPVFPALNESMSGQTYVVPVAYSGGSRAGQLCGWIDFNINGVFDAGERACGATSAGAGTVNLGFTLPAGIVPGTTVARFRVGYTATQVQTPTGLADSGEVEDHQVVIQRAADLVVSKTGPATAVQGTTVSYTITVTNNGRSNVTGAQIADTVPSNLTGVSWTCSVTGTADCNTGAAGTDASGAGNAISLTAVQLNAGAGNTVTITVTGTATTTGTFTNTATVSPPAGTIDTNTANNSSSVTTTITPAADLTVVKTGPATAVQGNAVSYAVTVTNNGPSNVTGAQIADAVPSNLTGVSWTCVAAGTADCNTGVTGTGATGTGNAIALNAVQLNAGAGNTVTITVTGTATTTGSITNTATVAPPAGSTDPSSGNNSSSVTTAITPAADLAVVKAGPASVVQGNTVTYTVTVTNNGPSNVTGAQIADTVPSNLTGVSWTCSVTGTADCNTGAAGTDASGAGNAISLTAVQLNAGAGNTVTITVTGAATTTGSITNTATVTPPAGTTDPNNANNSSSVTTTITPAADLAVVKTGPASVVQGNTVTYTVTVTNNGPSNVTGAQIADSVPSNVTVVSWTCVAAGTADCDTGLLGTGATGSGNAISLTAVQLNAGAGNTVTITVTGTATTTGTFTNTATVTPPAGVTDPDTANNASSVTTTITPAADLAVTKSGPSTVGQGDIVTYTITVTNSGPSNVTGATASDTVPANLTGVTWNCASTGTAACGTANGSGNDISLSAVQLNAGAGNSITITVTGTAATTGSITNTATVAPPAGTTDPNNANNTSSVTTTITPAADVAITKTGTAIVVQGNTVTYTIVATNNGPSAVTGVSITDTVPSNLAAVGWTCVAAGGAACGTASGTGNAISLTNVSIPAGAGNSVTITVTATATTVGSFTNTATINPPAGTTDPNTANNTASQPTTITPAADLAVTKTGPVGQILAGQSVTYTVAATNAGPSPVTGADITDTVPADIAGVNWTCTATAGSDCDNAVAGTGATGTGNSISLPNVDLAVSGTITITITGTAVAAPSATITNTVSIDPPAGVTDPNLANNTAATTASGTPAADLAIAKSGPATSVQGTTVTYTVVVTNNGPSSVTNALVNDAVPSNLTGVTWTCAAAPNCGATTGNGSLNNATVTLASGQSATFTITGTATATGTITNTATVAPPAGTVDGNAANDTSSVQTIITPAADLAVTKAGTATVVQGNSVAYTITVTNNGPSAVTAARVQDAVPSNVTSVTWTCAESIATGSCAANGSGNTIDELVNLGSGGQVTFTVIATATTPGAFTNTVTVAPPAGTTDPTPANNTASQPTEITPAADLVITKSGTPSSAAQGETATYTLTATNAGPSNVSGASIVDNVPSNLTAVIWTCTAAGTADCDTTTAGTGATGSGNAINLAGVQINAGAGNAITLTVTGVATTVGTFTNTATIQPPGGTTDPTPANNSDIEVTSVTPSADLTVTKTGTATVVQGNQVTYTITVTNSGPSPVTGALVSDTVPAGLTNVSFRCVVSGTGDCDTTSGAVPFVGTGNAIALTNVQLNSGASLTITVTGTATTVGSITNTVTVAPPAGTTDPNTANNTASQPTTITPAADLAVTKTGPATVVQSGGGATTTVTYTMTVTNNGPSAVTGARVEDTVPSSVTSVTWTCAESIATGSCAANGSGNTIDELVNLSAGGQVTFTVVGTPTTVGSITNTVTVALPAGTTDPNTANNSASQPTTITPAADLAVTKTGPATIIQGQTATYSIVVTNNGPSAVSGAQVADTVPNQFTSVTSSCVANGAADCDTSALGTGATGSGNAISLANVQIAVGASLTITVTGVATTPTEPASVTNTATVTPPAGTTDPTSANNSSSVNTTIFGIPAIAVTKSDAVLVDTGPGTGPDPGDTLRYTITIVNTGTGAASNVTVSDLIDSMLTPSNPTASQGTATLTGNSLSATLGSIPVNGSATITYDAVVPAVLPAGVTQVANQAFVSGANFPTVPSDDPDTPAGGDPTVTPLTAAPLLAVDKAVAIVTDAAPTGPSPGDVFEYTLTVTNTGNQNAAAVAVSDLVDPNVTLIPGTASTNQGTITAGAGGGAMVAATIGTVTGGGGSATVTYRVQVPNPIPAGVNQVQNQAVTTGGNFPTVLSNDPSTPTPGDPTVLPLTAEPSIAVTKAAGLFTDADADGVPSPGDTLLYTVTITNSGNTGATGVTLTDTIDSTFSSITNIVAAPGSASLSGQTLSATFGTIPGGGGTATLTYRALIPDPLPSSFITQVANQAIVAGNNFPVTPSDDPSTPTGGDPTVTLLTAAPRIAVDKQDTLFTDADGDGVPSPGDTLLYTVTITNSGNTTADNISLSDTIDSNTVLIAGSAQASPAAPISALTTTASGVNATFTAIPGRGGQAVVTFRVRVRSPLPPGVTQVANQAVVTGDNFPSTVSNDPDTAQAGDPTVTPLTATPRVSATKTAVLVGDGDGDGQADPGDTLAYTVTVTNAGNRDATSVNVADVVESNLVLVAGSVQTSPVVAPTILGPNISATFPVVAGDGGTAVLSYRATVVSPLPAGVTQVTNQAQITGANFPPTSSDDPSTGAPGDPTVTPVVAQPIVNATKSATLAVDADGNGLVSPGDTLQYVVQIQNTGNQDALDLQFRDTVGANLAVVGGSLSVSPGAPISSNLATTATTVQADFSGLQGNGGTATVTFQVTIATPFPIGVTSVQNQGTVQPGPGGNFATTPTDDPSTGTVDDPTITLVSAAPVVTRAKTVALVADVLPTGPSAGDTLRYTITLTNTGNQVASNASLTDLVDTTFALPLAAGPTATGGGTAAISGRTITATWPTITPGAGNAVTLTFDATLPASLPAGVTQVQNQGNVTGGNFPGGPTNDPTTPAPDDPTVTPLLANPVVNATKTAALAVDADGDGVPSPGDTLTYTVVIRNSGNQDASGVTYNDIVDANLILQPQPVPVVTTTQGTPSVNGPATGGGSFSIPDIGTIPGVTGSVTITYQAQVKPALPAGVSSVTNQGVVDGANIPSSVTDDPSVPGTTDPTVTPLTLTPKLEAKKADALVIDADGDGQAEPGDTLSYTVTITNVGNQEATAVEFNDVVEANLALVAGSASVSPAAPSSTLTTTATTVNAIINSIPGAGGTAVVSFRVTIDNPLPGGVSFVQNQGTVSATNVPPFPTDDPATGAADDPTRTPVVAAPQIAATKNVAVATDIAPSGPSPGDTLIYTITITNSGNQTATLVDVTDIIDPNLEVVPSPLDVSDIAVSPGAPIGNVVSAAPGVTDPPFGGSFRAAFNAIPGGGNSATISYQAAIRSPVGAEVTQVANQAQVTGANFPPTPSDDPRTGTPDDPTVTPITAAPSVDATKNVSIAVDADGNGVASPGDTLAYSVAIVNAGNREATGVVFSDTVPANTTLVPGTATVSQGTVTQGTAGGNTVAADVGVVGGAGGSATVGFRVTINNPLPAGVTQVANQGTVSGTNFGSLPTDDPRTGTNDDPTVTPISAAPVIAVDKTADLVVDADGNGVPSPGDTLLYAITITNGGNQTATGVSLTDVIESNLTSISAVSANPGTATLVGSTVTATLGDIGGGGQQATVSFRAQIRNPIDDGATQVANQATVTGGNFAATPSNDPSTAQGGDPTVTPITAAPAITATKRDSLAVDADGDGVPSPGDTLAYAIVITNSGNSTARGVRFADTLDPNVALVAGSIVTTPPGALGVTSSSGFDGEFPAIVGGGGTGTITYRVVVANPLPAGVTQVANQTVITPAPVGGNFPATVSDDPDTGAALDPTVTPLTAAPRIAVTKTDALFVDADGSGSPSPGDTLLYTVTVINSGNGAATGVALTDIIDANLSANTPQASQGTVSVAGNTLNAALGTIPGGGGNATFSYRAVIADPLPAGVTQVANQAIVSGNFPTTPSDDPDTAAGGDPTVTPLTANPVIGVTKADALLTDADADGVASPGDTLLYTITVTNTGNQTATGVTLSDVIGANLTGSNEAASQGTATITGSTLTAALDGIPGRGGSATVTFQALIANPLPAGVTQVANQAVVSGANFPSTVSDDPDTATPGDPTVTPLRAAPVIAVDKTATLNTDADGNGSPSPGDTLLYTITVRNSGNQAGIGAVANDVNDPNVTLIAGSIATSQGAVTAGNAGGNTVGVDLGVIPGGGTTATVTYLVRVVSPLPAGVTSVANQALVSGANFATTPSNDPGTPSAGDPTVTQLTAAPVLNASKAATLVVDADGNGQASPGDTVLYTVTIANSGNQAAGDTVYTDTLDPNTTVTGPVQASQGTATGSGQSVSASFGTVPGGATVTLSYRALIAASVPPGATQVVNQGTVSATGVSPVRTDDPATGALGDPTIVQIVAAPRVLMTKTDVLSTDVNANGAADLGDSITYTLIIQNVGNTAAQDGVFTDTPDPNTRLVAGSVTVSAPGGATVTLGNGAGDTSVGVSIPTIGPGGEQVTISFRVQILDPLADGVTQVANQATLACGCPGSPILSDDPQTTAAADPTVTPLRRLAPPSATPALRAAKVGTLAVDADRSGGASSGDTIAYTVQIVSAGDGIAQNVVFNDTVDPNTTIIAGSVTTTRGAVTAGQQGGRQIQVAVGNLAAGNGVTIGYRVKVNPRVPASTTRIRNQGTVTALGIAGVATDDPSTGVAGDPTDLGVAGTTRLRIRKFGPVRAAAGTRTLYTIRVTNLGPNSAAGVVVTDQLPRGMVVVGRPRNATVRGRTVTWRIRNVAARRTVTLTLPVRVTARIGVRLTNTATARASNAAPVRARARTLVVRFRPPIPTG